MKNRNFVMCLLIAFVVCVCVFGCAINLRRNGEYSHTWYRECSWCKGTYDSHEIVIGAQIVGAHNFATGETEWNYEDQEQAKERTIEIYAKKYPDKFTTDGYSFCSLRCMNSYLASKDVKEERKRIIRGE